MTERTGRVALAVLAMTSPAWSHDGHGTTEGGTFLHYLVEPLHVSMLAIVAAAVVGVGTVAYRRWTGGRRSEQKS